MAAVYSAPGKALLAGGYLALDPKYNALVIALSARMHAVVTQNVEKPAGSNFSRVTVSSPQFAEGEWSYDVDPAKLEATGELEELHGRKNPFIKATLLTLMAYIHPETHHDIVITIFSDPGYHTTGQSVKKSSDNGKMSFYYHDEPITEVPKTGMGSSAGLVTSLMAALMSCYGIFDGKQLDTLHNLSQLAHCMAQGKVGSGFDVGAAVYGSIVYKRFDAALINSVIGLAPQQFWTSVRGLVDDADWGTRHQSCSMPPGIRLLMGDIAGGSETPKLVGKVNSWRKANPERSLEVYTSLNEANTDLTKALQNLDALHEKDPTSYSELLTVVNSKTAIELAKDTSAGSAPITAVTDSVSRIRKWLRTMTIESGAEIEPDSQKVLLDNCNTLQGCLGGVVPGAGGFDAICLLVGSASIDSIKTRTASDAAFKSVKWLDLTEQKNGLLEESAADFDGLLESKYSSAL